MVRACLDRAMALAGGATDFSVVEPSAGDGAFLRALGSHDWRGRVSRIVAIEPLEIEAEKCRHALLENQLIGDVICGSAIPWAANAAPDFDVAVGNPPFVRYQFISKEDQAAIDALGSTLRIQLRRVGNLWIPVLLAALSRLRTGGVFAFVVPTECLTGCSAAVLRQWLLDECESVRFDLFAPESFPDVLQEVAILSGRRVGASTAAEKSLEIVDHDAAATRRWRHNVTDSGPWTRYLLDPSHLSALESAQRLPDARPFKEIVRFAVGIVTGATGYFSVDDGTLAAYELRPWAQPLLPRLRHAPGLVFSAADHAAAQAEGAKVWLLDFGKDRANPLAFASAASYIRLGEQLELPQRYKCRIREPWYRVPGITRGELLLSKRSHFGPRLVLNQAGAYTTDTIYRGHMATTKRTAEDVVASFHNTLTLLTAEIEGRSFGGGVHELVPSEIARLTTVVPPGVGNALSRLDAIARREDSETLVKATDDYLVRIGSLPRDLLPTLREAREILVSRRFDRNRRRETERADDRDVEAA